MSDLPFIRAIEAAPTLEKLPPTEGRFLGDLVKVGRELDYVLYVFDGLEWRRGDEWPNEWPPRPND